MNEQRSNLIRLSYLHKIKNVVAEMFNRDADTLLLNIPLRSMAKRALADEKKVSIETVVDEFDGTHYETEYMLILMLGGKLKEIIGKDFQNYVNLSTVTINELHRLVCEYKAVSYHQDMKFIKMYQTKSKDELEEIEKNVDPYIEESIEEIFNGVQYFDLNDEIQTVFIIVTPTQEHELKHYAYALGTKTVFVDVTTQALHRFFNTNDPEVLKMMADDKGVAMVEEFITNNTSVDEVLDKIGLYGMGSLNEIDSTFLKRP
jgi:hypothetical protein